MPVLRTAEEAVLAVWERVDRAVILACGGSRGHTVKWMSQRKWEPEAGSRGRVSELLCSHRQRCRRPSPWQPDARHHGNGRHPTATYCKSTPSAAAAGGVGWRGKGKGGGRCAHL